MVERQGSRLPDRHPFRGGGIVGAPGRTTASADPERDRSGRLPGVAIRAGIDTDDSPGVAPQPGLFPELTDERLLDRLLELDESAGKREKPLEGRSAPADQQHLPPPEPDGIHRQGRTLVVGNHRRREDDCVLGVERGRTAPGRESHEASDFVAMLRGDKH